MARDETARVPVMADLTVVDIARAFCELSDDAQAQVLIEVARIGETWENPNVDQWIAVGQHLRTCACSTPAARDLVYRMALGLRLHPTEPDEENDGSQG